MKSRKRLPARPRRAGVELHVVRNGSRGACWLEPLVEVVTDQGRVGYGPVTPADVPGLFAADFLNGGQHALSLGLVAEIRGSRPNSV